MENEQESIIVDDSEFEVANNEESESSMAGDLTCNGSNEWTCRAATPITKIKVLVSKELFAQIRNIESSVRKKFGSDNEFSIFLHGEYNENGDFEVTDDYYIPEQDVSGASVDYKEAPIPYYNGCLHRHPNGVTSFSGTDKRYINSNFEFSLLYVNGIIKTGIININYVGNRRLQTTVEVVVLDDEVHEDVDIGKIKKFVPETPIVPYKSFSKSGIITPTRLLTEKERDAIPDLPVNDDEWEAYFQGRFES